MLVRQSPRIVPFTLTSGRQLMVVVTDSATRENIGRIKHTQNSAFTPDTEKGRALLAAQKEVFRNSTSLVVYTFAPEENDPHRYDMGSAWLFVENFCLAAVDAGLGSQLFGLWDEFEEQVNRLLGVPHPDYRPPEKLYKAEAKWIFRETWKAAD